MSNRTFTPLYILNNLHLGQTVGVRKTHVQDQVNAISLLGRAELAGADAGHRWHDLATHALPRIHDRCNPFVDLHFGYALARAGDDAAVGRLLGGVARHAARCTSPLWRDIALPALRGVIAHARGEQRQAVAQLHAVAPGLHRLGGSTAQQAWFAQMRLQSAPVARAVLPALEQAA
jgi:hypothetical protein